MKGNRKKVSRNFLFDNYSKCFVFLKELKWFFVFSVGIFCLFFLVGFAFPIFFREEIILKISQLASSIKGKNLIEIIFFIFLNNTQAGFFSFISGLFIGVFPLFTLILNGYLLGFVANAVVAQEGLASFWKILPHGIFELPAIFFSTSIGIKIGFDLIRGRKNLKENYANGLCFFISVVIPLLFIAAIIEGILIIFL